MLHLNSCAIEQLKKHSSNEVHELVCLRYKYYSWDHIQHVSPNVGNKEEWTPFSQTPRVDIYRCPTDELWQMKKAISVI